MVVHVWGFKHGQLRRRLAISLTACRLCSQSMTAITRERLSKQRLRAPSICLFEDGMCTASLKRESVCIWEPSFVHSFPSIWKIISRPTTAEFWVWRKLVYSFWSASVLEKQQCFIRGNNLKREIENSLWRCRSRQIIRLYRACWSAEWLPIEVYRR